MSSSTTARADKDLISRAKVSKVAFLEIYDTYFQQIYDYAYYRTLDQGEAEEITSQTFLKALEGIGVFEYRGVPLVVWLYKIASNSLIDLYRKKGKTVDLREDDDFQGTLDTPEHVLIQKDQQEQLIILIETLPFQQQQAIVLRYLQNLSYKEIAEVLDKSEGAIKQLLYRGLMSLRQRMVNYE